MPFGTYDRHTRDINEERVIDAVRPSPIHIRSIPDPQSQSDMCERCILPAENTKSGTDNPKAYRR